MIPMIPMKSAITALTTMALVAALSSTVLAASDPEPAELTGMEWTLVSITSEGTNTAVPDGVTATLSLIDGEAKGSGGCNSFFASYKVDGAVLGFSPIGATEMFCVGPEQTVEDAYLAALGSVAYWAIADDGSLRLLDNEETELLSFNVSATGIEGVTWLLRQQAVGDTQAEIPEGIVVSLQLRDGEAGGNGGCNSYRAGYQLGENTIAFAGIASTLKACQEPAGTVEATYFGNLGQVSKWESDGALLTLSGGDDSAPLLSFEAAPQASVVGSWTAQSINNGSGGVVSSESTTSVTAQFSENGDLTGFDGCNDYFTTYAVDADTIAISEAIGATKKACQSDELTVQVQEYYAALGAAATWSVRGGGDLQLRDDAGSLQVDYALLDS